MLSEKNINYIIKENIKQLITESQESKSQSEAIKLVMQTFNWDKEQANNFVRQKLRNDIPSLRDKQIAKFTLGVTRMFCEKQLSDAGIISELNATLKLLTAHLNEYDRNLNGISAQKLIEKFKKVRNDNIESEKNDINAMNFSDSSNYQIIPINTFEEAQEYGEYTNPNSQWCLTDMEDMFNSYTSNGVNQIYFCLRNDFEQVPCRVGENTPLDEYGLSMLCVIVNENGELAYCTTRWNHKNGGSDNAMNAKEISQVIGANFYQVFKPNTKWQDLLSEVKEKLKQGLPLDDIFDDVNVVNDVYIVLLSDKINIINKKRQFISEQWFDEIWSYNNGLAIVELNGKMNGIKSDGKYISEQWFDGIGNFKAGVSKVWIDDKYNFINTNGDFISKQWFDYIHDYDYDGFAKVKLDDKYNFINTNGELLSNQWFDDVWSFREGVAQVNLNSKYNFINTNGDFISKQWFDDIYDYDYYGFAKVKLDGKFNFINTNGEVVSKQWFDIVWIFKEGLAKVKIDDKYNFINTNGELISKQWFDDAMDYGEDLISVTIDGRQLKMNRKGELFSVTENKQFRVHKKSLKLSETVLENIIKESINKVLLNEYN